MTEYEKMMKGELFNAADKCYFRAMVRADRIQRKLNANPIWNYWRRDRLVKKLFGSIDGLPYCMYMPLFVVYGQNIHVGKHFFCNYNTVLQDYARINIGDNVWIGPNVTITTNLHPMIPEERNVCETKNSILNGNRGNFQYAKPVTIGNNVLIYSGAILCPGVTIGDNAIIGAGSVVTRDIPANVLAFGVPCRAVREIIEADRILDLQPKPAGGK